MKRRMWRGGLFVFFSLIFAVTGTGFAAHPLITDDTGTQGTGKFQIELNGEWATDQENTGAGGVRAKETQAAVIFSAGIRENIDLVLSVPYQWLEVRDEFGLARADGFGDATAEVKLRLYEREGFSLAVKPGVILPTGDEDRGLGAGKTGYSAYLISDIEKEPVTVFINLGYTRNENDFNERADLWHASVAAEYEIVEDWELAGDIGIETNPDASMAVNPAFLIVGVIYEPSDNVDLALGVKYGLNEPETDFTILPGVTVRF